MGDQSGADRTPPELALPGGRRYEQPDNPTDGPVGFFVVAHSGRIVGSAGVSELLTEAGANPVGSMVSGLAPAVRASVTDPIADAFEDGEAVEFDLDTDSNRELTGLAMPLGELVVVQLWDLSNYAQLSREVTRSRKILDTLEDGIYTLDEAFVIVAVNDAVTEITGYSRDELVGSHASKLAGDETISMATEILDQLRSECSDVGLIESSIQGADGDPIPIETRFSTVEFANGDIRRVGLLRDLTDRRRHEHTLQELNRSARQLLRADDERAVCETIVEVATTVWPDATAVVYRFDAADSRLVPAVASGTSADSRGPGTPEWNAFATGTSAVKRDDSSETPALGEVERPDQDDGETPTGRVIEDSTDDQRADTTLFASLEEHGLLTVTFGPDRDPGDTVESVELLAANAVAALGRVERETMLSRRREELSARNDRLERLHEFNDLLRQINSILVDASTLRDVATAVCDHLVGAEEITFAWFGETYRSSDGLQPVARAGDGDGYLDDLAVLGMDGTCPSPAEGTEPTSRVLAAEVPVSVADVSRDLRGAAWRERALVRGFQSAMSVPIEYNDLTYGVLSVYADQQGAFEETLGELLAELGGTIGNALNSLETKRSLRTHSRVELTLRIAGPDVLSSRLAAALGEPVSIEGVVPRAENRSVLYLQSPGDPTRLSSAVRAVEEIRRLGEGNSSRVAATVTDHTLVDRFADYGADVRHIQARPAAVEVTALLPQSVDVRGFVDALEAQYSTVDLRARRERPATDADEFSTAVLDRLTDRQAEVVETAHRSGYFEWPRDRTGEEVAETLDITQPTFNRHLRTTEQTLFSVLFDGD